MYEYGNIAEYTMKLHLCRYTLFKISMSTPRKFVKTRPCQPKAVIY